MLTVLIVDDDPRFLHAASDLLTSAGYNVLRAASGIEAVELLERKHHEIKLTIVDLALPDINGFEIIGAIARRAHSVKVLATTSVYKDAHLEMAASVGADAALRKPAEGRPLPREWLETVQKLIGKPEGRANAAGVHGPTDESEKPNGNQTDL